ncbi:MAG: TRAP transporter large permease subunit, partial [Blautia sp.]|nr:TRAP transporter large permease subunit [Blautia sp.]
MAFIIFGSFILLLALGVPVAFSICTASAISMFAGYGDQKMMIVVQRMFQSCDSFSLIAVPFFILAGDLLAKGKISKVLVE